MNDRTNVSRSIRDALSRIGVMHQLQAGQQLQVDDAEPAYVYWVQEGELDVSHPSKASLVSGAVFDRGGLPQSDRPVVLVARRPSQVRRIPRTDVAALLARAPGSLQAALAGLQTDEESADAYVARLAEQGLRHRAVEHPYLQALAGGALPDVRWALQDFARHYYGYSRWFPKYLTATISRLESADHRAALLDNLTEESGTYADEEKAELAELGIPAAWYDGVPHPVLFARFARFMGADLGEHDEADQVVCWRELFLEVLRQGSPAEAIGALGLGTENIVSTMYQPFVAVLPALGLDGPDTVFFPLHTAVDDDHQEVLQSIAVSYASTPEGRADLRRGMLKALQCRSAFWDWLYARALDPARAEGVL